VLVGFGASLLSTVAVVFGFVLIGASYGTVMLSRAAAADMYPPERRAKGIALVLFGAAFGAILVMPIVGNIIDRLGRLRALVGGLLLIGFCSLSVVWVVESITATSLALFGIGLGWNFSYVAATAELADKTVPVERGKILGFTDLLAGLLSAVLASLGGLTLAAVGLARRARASRRRKRLCSSGALGCVGSSSSTASAIKKRLGSSSAIPKQHGRIK
jgi:MFS family permease